MDLVSSPPPVIIGNDRPCGGLCGQQTGPAAERSYALSPRQQITDRNAQQFIVQTPPNALQAFTPPSPRSRTLSPPLPSVHDELITLTTPYYHSRRYDQEYLSASNYTWTRQRALDEQLDSARTLILAPRELKLSSEWIISDGGGASRLIYRLTDAQGQKLAYRQVAAGIVEQIQELIYKCVHEMPTERVVVSTANPPDGVSSGELATLMPLLANYRFNDDDELHILYLYQYTLTQPIVELRARYPDDFILEDHSLELFNHLSKEIYQFIDYMVERGFISLSYWSVGDLQRREWLNAWELDYDPNFNLAYPNMQSWTDINAAVVNSTRDYAGWQPPSWSRSQLLRLLHPLSSAEYYWQYWPVQTSWWITAAALYQVWPREWAMPYIQGQGTTTVIWGWPMISLQASNIKKLTAVYNAMRLSLETARQWSGAHPIYRRSANEKLPEQTTRTIIAVPILNDLIYRQVWVVILNSNDPPLRGYNAALANPDSSDLLTELLTPNSAPLPLKNTSEPNLGPLPCFICQSRPDLEGLVNLRHWLHNILQMLGHPFGTYRLKEIGHCWEINLYTAEGQNLIGNIVDLYLSI